MINFKYTNQLEEYLDLYGAFLSNQGKRPQLVHMYLNPIRQFICFLNDQGITDPNKVTAELLTAFQLFLYDKRDFTRESIMTFLQHIRSFFEYIVQSGALKENPAKNTKILPPPELPQKQLSHFYTFDEVLRRYLRDQEKYVSYAYLNNVEKHLKGFIKYLRVNEIGSFYTVTESALLKYRQFLWDEFVTAGADGLVVRSQKERLRCVVRLFRYLKKEGILKDNPAQNLDWEDYYKDIIEKAKALPEKPAVNNDITELDKLKIKFLKYERGKGKSEGATNQYNKSIKIFYEFLKEKGISNLAQVNKRLLLDYFTYVCNYVGVRGSPAGTGYKNKIICGLKQFFRFLVRFGYLAKNPTEDLEFIKEERGLPRTCMTEREVNDLLDKPRLSHDPLEIRDKAMMEVLFSTAIRSHELCSLNIEDIDHQNGMIRVNKPKGGASYQRIVPIGTHALDCLSLYLRESRPAIENGDSKTMFLSCNGRRLRNDSVLNVVKKYAHQCGFRKNITTHSFRVTCATSLFKNGADIRYVQEMLGHKNITSTQIYTRLAPVDLKKIHQRCHPRERKITSNTEVEC